MKDPKITVGILIAYIISIVLIRVVMANRKPFELKSLLVVYNMFQVGVSFYIFLEVSARLCFNNFLISTWFVIINSACRY